MKTNTVLSALSISNLFLRLSLLVAICFTPVAYGGYGDHTGEITGVIDTIGADQTGSSNSLWITMNAAPNQWIQIKETSSGKNQQGVFASAITVAHALGKLFTVRTITNSQFPSELEMHDSYIINTLGGGMIGHIVALVKPHPDEPLYARILTPGGYKNVEILDANQAAVAAVAVIKDLPVTYEEFCVTPSICNGLSWIQIGNAP